MRLELVFAPDPVHRRRRQTGIAAANRRTLHCVLPSGGVSGVVASTRATSSSSICRGRPEREACTRPSRPRSAKFRRHSLTIGSDTPAYGAICVFVTPSAALSTIRARSACCWEADGARDTERSIAWSSPRARSSPRAPRQPPYSNYIINGATCKTLH